MSTPKTNSLRLFEGLVVMLCLASQLVQAGAQPWYKRAWGRGNDYDSQRWLRDYDRDMAAEQAEEQKRLDWLRKARIRDRAWSRDLAAKLNEAEKSAQSGSTFDMEEVARLRAGLQGVRAREDLELQALQDTKARQQKISQSRLSGRLARLYYPQTRAERQLGAVQSQENAERREDPRFWDEWWVDQDNQRRNAKLQPLETPEMQEQARQERLRQWKELWNRNNSQ